MESNLPNLLERVEMKISVRGFFLLLFWLRLYFCRKSILFLEKNAFFEIEGKIEDLVAGTSPASTDSIKFRKQSEMELRPQIFNNWTNF